MMRFTRLIAASAKRTVRSSKVNKDFLLVPLDVKQKSVLTTPVKVAGKVESGKQLTTPFLLTSKSPLVPVKKSAGTKKAAVTKKKKKWSAAARRVASKRAKEAAEPYLRFFAALKEKGCVKGKVPMKKAAKLWQATRHIKDFKRRVEAAVRVAKKGKRHHRKTAQRDGKVKRRTTKKKMGKTKSGVRRVYRKVSKAKTVSSAA